jgi:hypothetical protein
MATTNKKSPVRKSNPRYASSTKSARSKSRTGSSSIARSSKSSLFTRRNGLIAAGMAAVAGLAFVAFSFASTAPPNQYSLSSVCSPTEAEGPVATTNTEPTTKPAENKDSQTCRDNSAEGAVYRMYKGVFNREPNQGELAYWTQELAGKRVGLPTVVGKLYAGKGAASLKASTDTAFLTALYSNLLLRSPDPKGLASWEKKLKAAKPWTREKVLVNFISTSEAKRKNAVAFNAYILKATPVVIKETAKEDQKKRLAQMAAYAKTAKTAGDAAGKHALNAKNALNAAKSSSNKAKPTRADLQAIGENQKAATAEAAKARTQLRIAAKAKASAGRLQQRAAALARSATDIASDPATSKAKLDANYALVKAYSANADKAARAAGATVGSIAQEYKVAEGKYEAELNRIAAAQAAAAAAAAANRAAANRAAADKDAAAKSVANAAAALAAATTAIERARAQAALDAAKRRQAAAIAAIAAATAAALNQQKSVASCNSALSWLRPECKKKKDKVLQNPLPSPVHAKVCQTVPTTPKRHKVKVKVTPFGPTVTQSVPYIPPRWNYERVCVRT